MIEATIARARAAGNTDLEGPRQPASSATRRRQGRRPHTRAHQAAAAIGLDILINEISKVRDPASRDEQGELRDSRSWPRLAAAEGGGEAVDPTAFDQHRQQTLLLLAEVAQIARASRLPRGTARGGASGPGRKPAEPDSGDTVFADAQRVGRARPLLRLRQADRASESMSSSRRRGCASARRRGTGGCAESRGSAARGYAAGWNPSPSGRRRHRCRSVTHARRSPRLLGRVETDPAANTGRKSRCTMCHDLTASRRSARSDSRRGESLMPSARFTHEHHVTDARRQLRNVPHEHQDLGERPAT